MIQDYEILEKYYTPEFDMFRTKSHMARIDLKQEFHADIKYYREHLQMELHLGLGGGYRIFFDRPSVVALNYYTPKNYLYFPDEALYMKGLQNECTEI